MRARLMVKEGRGKQKREERKWLNYLLLIYFEVINERTWNERKQAYLWLSYINNINTQQVPIA